jgi:hypothetical protein
MNDKTDCSNYLEISLVATSYKIISNKLLLDLVSDIKEGT